MAYVSTLNEQNQDEGLAPSSNTITPQASSSMAQTQPTGQVNRGGSQFADVSRYLTQNADQGNRLASKIGSGVVQAGNEARSGLTNAQQHFDQAVNRSTVPYDANLVNRVSQDPRSLFNFPQQSAPTVAPPLQAQPQAAHGGGPNHIKNIIPKVSRQVAIPAPMTPPTQNPTISDQPGYDAYEAMRNAQYGGPTDITQGDEFKNAAGLAQSASKLSDQSLDTIGQQDLLRGLYGNSGSYGGAKNLDSLLLQGKGARDILGSSASQNKGLGSLFGDTATASNLNATNAAQTTQNTANQAGHAFDGQYDTITQDLAQRLAAKKKEVMDSTKGKGRKDDAARGLTTANVTTPEDYQKIQALNKLLGTDYSI